MRKQDTYADMIAAFAAKGGKVQTIESGVRAIESDRTIYAAMREGKRAAADAIVADRRAESRATAQRDAFDAAKYDGWTDAAAHEYSQEAKG
jgi:hypothetical protein